MTSKQIVLLGLALTLFGCQSTSETGPAQKSMDQAMEQQVEAMRDKQSMPLDNLPDAVSQALLPGQSLSEDPLFDEEKYDISAKAVDAVSFFAGLVEGTPYSVAVHPEVKGAISLSLKQVSLEQVFELVSDLYGYDVQKFDQIFRVFPSGMRTETFPVNYLLMQRDGATQTSIASGGVTQSENNQNSNTSSVNNFSGNSSTGNNIGGGSSSNNTNGTNISTRTETDFWSELKETLQSMVGVEEGRMVMVTPQAGLVTVRAMPGEIRSVKEYLKVSEEIVKRQVVLEARIIEVSLSDEYQQGINWNQIANSNSGSTQVNFSTTAGNFGNQISAAIGNVTSLSFLNEDFSGVLTLLETQGNVQVLSSPRVTATNNQKAVIKVGDDEYFVTEVSNQNTITSGTTTVTPNIELTPFFSGIALDVTPQIDDKGGVLLHVHPSVIETDEQEKVITLNEERYVLPLAQSNIRESDTVIHANSGEIVVIGGLMQSIVSESDSKTPLLGDIPLLGNLFKSKNDIETKKELVILLKPTVVDANTWKQQLKQSRDQMADWLYVE
ncbi:pilus (MSHA type) biogenesis protein MshL [Aliiglaciecola sp. 2_MG-2023]|uniref:pilus (MSHA type) biogenesis protein MshL n=1 Tax=unclassified Aliiglaciecola TaxID=2593648 RepID=UPI0026E2BC42|nr:MULTISPECIES: pilus (MSHA type) biogenesis protein MshL [unclassified Aliiglaciecola]MDO6713225.1 pilus (MSHA type) biogenesis protein MshL [Aliiglaciecola sp. 2_MG-2023]MDO6754337.1 pilus (MSHA type) biogenesis protein MshL [Aliiglaciecola sp. 1_MG-2023]